MCGLIRAGGKCALWMTIDDFHESHSEKKNPHIQVTDNVLRGFTLGKALEGKAQPPPAGAAISILFVVVLIIEIQKDISSNLADSS